MTEIDIDQDERLKQFVEEFSKSVKEKFGKEVEIKIFNAEGTEYENVRFMHF